MTRVLLLPFHQDERLGDDAVPLPVGTTATVVDPELPDGDQWPRLAALHDALAAGVAAEVAATPLTTVVTGDCLAALGTLAGAQRAGLDPSLVWFDAHGDVHTLASSTSGYLGGMPLRMAVGADPERLAGPLGLRPLAEERVVLVDARDLDPAEQEFLATSAVRRRPVTGLQPDDAPDGPLLVHVDLDVVDAAELPGLRFPAPGGPSAADVLAAVGRLLDTGRVAVLEMTCPWFAPQDEQEQAVRAALVDRFLALAGDRQPTGRDQASR